MQKDTKLSKPNVYLRDELIDRGYEYRELMLDRRYRQFYKNGRLVLTMASYYDYPFVSPTAKRISKDKSLSYALASAYGVTIPATVQTTDPTLLSEFLRRYKKLIVKPVGLGGGRALTINITDQDDLQKAVTLAARLGKDPLVQQQFDGEEIRLTVINGKVTSVIYRQAPVLVGDGHSTLAQLLRVENEAREKLVFELLSYPQLSPEMIKTEFDPEKILKNGERLRLSNASMIRDGASFYGITQEVHPSFIALAEKLAQHLNPPFLVVDFMVKDYTKPGDGDNYIFLEFNTAPALQIYSSLRGGDAQEHVISELADLTNKYANAYC